MFMFPVYFLLTNTTYKNIINFKKREKHENKHILNRLYCEHISFRMYVTKTLKKSLKATYMFIELNNSKAL
jgi:hypothetical protein